ncbi:GNAT family N-acetyltransferase [Occultella kanbiaonis]|uniref:GNAT family N-acetyltransferase n=1 Tax=Occultella kanbiaonis TaxID=2675754 RepID=UPI0012B84466|nr:GNAT family N-acetyltransferase [Occultella kanbiaonis]
MDTIATTFRISEAPTPARSDETPDWRVRGAVAVSAAGVLEILGNTDLADTAETITASRANQKTAEKHLLVGLDADAPDGDPDSVLGVAWVYLPLKDNTHMAFIEVEVLARARRHGLGAQLWDAAVVIARGAGRTKAMADAGITTEPDADSPDALVPPTGTGRFDSTTPGARFALSRGFTLEQVERHSQVQLPVDPETLVRYRRESQAKAGSDYDLVTWQGPVPPEWVEQYCVLQTRMSTDAPSAGLDLQEEVWDAERVANLDQTRAAMGKMTYATAARHIPTGTLAGYTEIDTAPGKPDVLYQENTLVLAEHRGKRLGMLVKAANLEVIAREVPDARRVHTWNAEENNYMLDINVALGFRQASVWAAWQLTL